MSGIGAIPAATALALLDKRDLGVHTEMFTDSVVDLVEAGVINGSRKERNRGKLVTAFLMGTKRLYDFVDDNPMVEMRPVDFTNDTTFYGAVAAKAVTTSANATILSTSGSASVEVAAPNGAGAGTFRECVGSATVTNPGAGCAIG